MARKILVVDNHPLMLKFMKGLLSKEGHEVLTAQDGLSAIDILETYIPDLIFIDLIMPNIGGERLCRIIRKRPEFRDAHLIILSAIAADEEVDFRGFGADACIAKAPFEQMGRHVLTTIEQADARGTGAICGTTLGLETVKPREITRELLAVKRHFEVILGSMTEGVLEITSNARIVYANPTALALIGMPEERLLASNFTELFSGADRFRIDALLGMKGSYPQSVFEDSPLILGERQVALKLLPIREKSSGAIVILEDVSEKKRMEAQLLTARKMEAIGTLAGGIAHDFNNILTAILSNASLAKLHVDSKGRIFENIEEIERASWRARDLTQQLLPFSRGGKPVRKVVSLPEMMKEICLSCLEGSGVRCEFAIPDDLWPVEMDTKQIRQALVNLLNNAVEAMPKGGAIRLGASNVLVGTEHVLPLKVGKYTRVSMRDQGSGISKEHLDRIFDPYFTTREAGKGLGLTAAYSIIDQHHGCITVESELGAGTTFHIFLPAVEIQDRISATEADAQGIVRGKGKILVMDDEEVLRKVLGNMLRYLGYSPAMASEGKEALELYANSLQEADTFDLVILDLTVPGGMGGEQTIREILRMEPTARAIVSSGYSNDPIMAAYREYGFSGVLEKPYQMSALSGEILRVMGKSTP